MKRHYKTFSRSKIQVTLQLTVTLQCPENTKLMMKVKQITKLNFDVQYTPNKTKWG